MDLRPSGRQRDRVFRPAEGGRIFGFVARVEPGASFDEDLYGDKQHSDSGPCHRQAGFRSQRAY